MCADSMCVVVPASGPASYDCHTLCVCMRARRGPRGFAWAGAQGAAGSCSSRCSTRARPLHAQTTQHAPRLCTNRTAALPFAAWPGARSGAYAPRLPPPPSRARDHAHSVAALLPSPWRRQPRIRAPPRPQPTKPRPPNHLQIFIRNLIYRMMPKWAGDAQFAYLFKDYTPAWAPGVRVAAAAAEMAAADGGAVAAKVPTATS